MSAIVLPIRPDVRVSTDTHKPSLGLAQDIEYQRLRLLEGLSLLSVLQRSMESNADLAQEWHTLSVGIRKLEVVALALNELSGDPAMPPEEDFNA